MNVEKFEKTLTEEEKAIVNRVETNHNENMGYIKELIQMFKKGCL